MKKNINHLISYNVFCMSKNFSLYRVLKNDKQFSYEQLKSFLISRNVTPPTRDYFETVLKRVVSEEFSEKHQEQEHVTEEITQEVEVVLEEEPKEETKPKRKRRSRKKKTEDASKEV